MSNKTRRNRVLEIKERQRLAGAGLLGSPRTPRRIAFADSKASKSFNSENESESDFEEDWHPTQCKVNSSWIQSLRAYQGEKRSGPRARPWIQPFVPPEFPDETHPLLRSPPPEVICSPKLPFGRPALGSQLDDALGQPAFDGAFSSSSSLPSWAQGKHPSNPISFQREDGCSTKASCSRRVSPVQSGGPAKKHGTHPTKDIPLPEGAIRMSRGYSNERFPFSYLTPQKDSQSKKKLPWDPKDLTPRDDAALEDLFLAHKQSLTLLPQDHQAVGTSSAGIGQGRLRCRSGGDSCSGALDLGPDHVSRDSCNEEFKVSKEPELLESQALKKPVDAGYGLYGLCVAAQGHGSTSRVQVASKRLRDQQMSLKEPGSIQEFQEHLRPHSQHLQQRKESRGRPYVGCNEEICNVAFLYQEHDCGTAQARILKERNFLSNEHSDFRDHLLESSKGDKVTRDIWSGHGGDILQVKEVDHQGFCKKLSHGHLVDKTAPAGPVNWTHLSEDSSGRHGELRLDLLRVAQPIPLPRQEACHLFKQKFQCAPPPLVNACCAQREKPTQSPCCSSWYPSAGPPLKSNVALESQNSCGSTTGHGVFDVIRDSHGSDSFGPKSSSTSLRSPRDGLDISGPVASTPAGREPGRNQFRVWQNGPDPEVLRTRILLASYNRLKFEALQSSQKLARISTFADAMTPFEVESLGSSKNSKRSAPEQIKNNHLESTQSSRHSVSQEKGGATLDFQEDGFQNDHCGKSANHSHQKLWPPWTVCPLQEDQPAAPYSSFPPPETVMPEHSESIVSAGVQESCLQPQYSNERTRFEAPGRRLSLHHSVRLGSSMTRKPLDSHWNEQEEHQDNHTTTSSQTAVDQMEFTSLDCRVGSISSDTHHLGKRSQEFCQDAPELSTDSEKNGGSLILTKLNLNTKLAPIPPAPSPSICSSIDGDGALKRMSKKHPEESIQEHPNVRRPAAGKNKGMSPTETEQWIDKDNPKLKMTRVPGKQSISRGVTIKRIRFRRPVDHQGSGFDSVPVDEVAMSVAGRPTSAKQVQSSNAHCEGEVCGPTRLLEKCLTHKTFPVQRREPRSCRKEITDQVGVENISQCMDVVHLSPASGRNKRVSKENKKDVTTQVDDFDREEGIPRRFQAWKRLPKRIVYKQDDQHQCIERATCSRPLKRMCSVLGKLVEAEAPPLSPRKCAEKCEECEKKLERVVVGLSEQLKAYKEQFLMMRNDSEIGSDHLDCTQRKSTFKKPQLAIKPRLPSPPRSYLQTFLHRSGALEEHDSIDQYLQRIHHRSDEVKPIGVSRPALLFPLTRYKHHSDCYCPHTETEFKPGNRSQVISSPTVPRNSCSWPSTPCSDTGPGRPRDFKFTTFRSQSGSSKNCHIHADSPMYPCSNKITNVVFDRNAEITSQVSLEERQLPNECGQPKESGITARESFLTALHRERHQRAIALNNFNSSDLIMRLMRQYHALQEFIDFVFLSRNNTPKGRPLPPSLPLNLGRGGTQISSGSEIQARQVPSGSESQVKYADIPTDPDARHITAGSEQWREPGSMALDLNSDAKMRPSVALNLARDVTQISSVSEIEARQVPSGSESQLKYTGMRTDPDARHVMAESEQGHKLGSVALDLNSDAKIRTRQSEPEAKRTRLGSKQEPKKTMAGQEQKQRKMILSTRTQLQVSSDQESNGLLTNSLLPDSLSKSKEAMLCPGPHSVAKGLKFGPRRKQRKFLCTPELGFSIGVSHDEAKFSRKAPLDQSLPRGFSEITPLASIASTEIDIRPPWCQFYSRPRLENGGESCSASECASKLILVHQDMSCSSSSLQHKQPNLEVTRLDNPVVGLKIPMIGSITKTASPPRQAESSIPLSLSSRFHSKSSPCLLQGTSFSNSENEMVRRLKSYGNMVLHGPENKQSQNIMRARGTCDRAITAVIDQKMGSCVLKEAGGSSDQVHEAPSGAMVVDIVPDPVYMVLPSSVAVDESVGSDHLHQTQCTSSELVLANNAVQVPEQAMNDLTETSNRKLGTNSQHLITSRPFVASLDTHALNPKGHTQVLQDNDVEPYVASLNCLFPHPDSQTDATVGLSDFISDSGMQVQSKDDLNRKQPELADDSPVPQVLPKLLESFNQSWRSSCQTSKKVSTNGISEQNLSVSEVYLGDDKLSCNFEGSTPNTTLQFVNTSFANGDGGLEAGVQTDPLDRHYSWMPFSLGIPVSDQPSSGNSVTSDYSTIALSVAVDDHSPNNHSLETSSSSNSGPQPRKASASNPGPSGYVYQGALEPSSALGKHCNEPAAGWPSIATRRPTALPECIACSPSMIFFATGASPVCPQPVPSSNTWNGDSHVIPLASGLSQCVQSFSESESATSEWTDLGFRAVTTGRSKGGAVPLQDPPWCQVPAGATSIKGIYGAFEMDPAGMTSRVRDGVTTKEVQTPEIEGSPTITKTGASSCLREILHRQPGEVLCITPRPGDLMIVRRRRLHRVKDNGYVSFYTKDHEHYPWNTGDLVLRLGKFISENNWQMSTRLKLFQRTYDRLWMSVGLLEKPDVMFPWLKRKMAVDRHCRFFVPRRGDLIVRLQALQHPTQLESWSLRTRVNAGDILVRVFIGNLGFEEPKEEVEGHVEIYVYGGKGLSWIFMGRDDCWYKDGYDLLERGLFGFQS